MAHVKSLLSLLVVFVFVSQSLSLNIYQYEVEDHTGETVSMKKYEGKVSLIVNVASLCGYTDASYRALVKLHDILSYGDLFNVLAFPCNQFAEQEPEETEVIVKQMTEAYGVEFPMFKKIDVVGEHASPLYRELVEQSGKTPEWNFYKYLVDHTGEVIAAWGTKTDVEEIFDEIDAAIIAAKAAAKTTKKTPPVVQKTPEASTDQPEATKLEEPETKDEL